MWEIVDYRCAPVKLSSVSFSPGQSHFDCHDITIWQKLSQLHNTLRQRQSGCYFADDNLKCIFFNENIWIAIKISLKFVSKGLVNIKPALV